MSAFADPMSAFADPMSAFAAASPVGRLHVRCVDDSLREIAWNDAQARAPASRFEAEVAAALAAYFDGRLRRFDLALAPAGTPFQRRAWAALCAIPHGETRAYGELAALLGSSARAVGMACAANPIPIVIPCHRVVATNGPGGFSGGAGLPTKAALLDLERGPPPLFAHADRR